MKKRPLLAGIAAGVLSLGIAPIPALATPPEGADGDFVARVHLTVLSADPASALAQSMSTDSAIKALATKVSGQDAALDKLAATTAKSLNVTLDNSRQASLAKLQSLSGTDFDTAYVNQLWADDSALQPMATAVKATTKNAAVKKLAEQAATLTAAQLPLLMDSGYVRITVPTGSSATPVQKLPGGATMDAQLMAAAQSGNGGFLWPSLPVSLVVLAAALAVSAVLGLKLFRRRRA